MSPLRAEIWTPKGWVPAFEIRPGDRSGSLSDVKPGGRREIYFLECKPDDSGSTISRSTLGVDREVGPLREVVTAGRETVRELRRGESFEMTLQPETSPAPQKMRFSHY